MNERKTKGLTNLNSDDKIIRDTCVSLARMYFSQFAAISCLQMNYEIVGECSPTNMGKFECGDICGNQHKWERKSQRLAIMPAIRANASRSILVGSPPGGGLQLSTVRSRKSGDAGKPGRMVKTRTNIRSATPRMLSIWRNPRLNMKGTLPVRPDFSASLTKWDAKTWMSKKVNLSAMVLESCVWMTGPSRLPRKSTIRAFRM